MDSSLRDRWRSYRETVLTIIIPQRRHAAGLSLYTNSISLIANAAVSAVLGFAFWVLAARLYPAEAVGVGAALLSAGGLLVFISTLGLGQGLVRYLPSFRAQAAALINSCFTLAGLAALVTALVFLAGIPLWSPALSFVRNDIRYGTTFIVFVIAGTIFNLLGDTYLALRRAEYSFVQGALMALLKLALVTALAHIFGIFGIIASWTAATAVLVALGLLFFLVRLQPGYRPLPGLQRQADVEMLRFSLANYVSLGLWSIPGWVLPVIVVNQAGSEANAYFFMGWSMAGLLITIPTATSFSLLAEGSQPAADLAGDIKKSLKLIALLALPAAVLLAVLGDTLLLVFGQQYSEQGRGLLWLLIPAVVPLSLNVLYLTAAKVRKRLGEIIGITAAITIGTLGLSYVLLPPMGILGPGVSWLATQALVALVLLPRFIGILREKQTGGTAG